MSSAHQQEVNSAERQLPKLKSLLKKYRQIKTMQASLLQLSELAGTVTDLDDFYTALLEVIQSLLTTNSMHIALANERNELEIVYCHNEVEQRLVKHVEFQDWRKGLTGLVYIEKAPLHCSAAERMALAKAEKIVLYGSSFVDWLGVPLKRGNQVIGVIALQSYNDKLYFDDRDCQLLEFIAEHIVTAIDRVKSRAMLEESINQRTRKLTESNRRLQLEIAERQSAEKMHQTLLRISEIVAATRSLAETFGQIHQQATLILPCQSNFYVATKKSAGENISYPYFQDDGVVDIDAYQQVEMIAERVMNAGKPLIQTPEHLISLNAEGNRELTSYLSDADKRSRTQTWLAAPLMDNGQPIGIVATKHHDCEAFDEKHLELFRFISQQVASAVIRERDLALVEQSKEALEVIVNERTKALQASNLNLRMQIDERRKAESRLYYEAHHDALTKLPNRAMFLDRLTHALRHVKRHPHNSFAVLFIDLDRFKVINDTLGHHAGDQFLVEIADRLRECVRDNDVLARLGGDEFVIMLDSLSSQDDVEEIADRIILAIEQPFDIESHSLYSNASIGIAFCNPGYEAASEILRDADAAMYQAKGLGRGRYVFFDDSMREQLLASMTLEQELRIAIKEKQFELHYQQISNLALTDTIGFEALLRWQHPTKGTLTPSEFLFMAEETGMIIEMERWILEEVGAQLDSWQSQGLYENALVGINLSGRYLTQPNQLSELIAHIQQLDISPARLILEFNEKAFVQQPELALKSLNKLKEFGVKLALDDYGAGQSSFNFLHSYPFEFIKLDRSLTRSLATNERNISLVKALHELGDQFGYRLVAEGIETDEVLQKLHQAGCEFGQGYHIDMPRKMSQPHLSKNKSYA